MSTFETAIHASKSLLAFYNANTAGNQIKKFADRKTAERRCALLAEELEAEGFTVYEIDSAMLVGTELIKRVESDDEGVATPVAKQVAEISITTTTEQAYVEHLAAELDTTVEDAQIKISSSTSGNKRGPVPAIAESMKLDRRTVCLETGEEWSNAGKIWTTHGTDWMTYAQHDKLTKTLYSAAKAGSPVTSVVNGRSFRLIGY